MTRPIEARQNLSNEPRNADKLTLSAALEQTAKAGGADLGLARQIGFGVQGHI